MSINRNNYEIFFLDYWEKQLSPGDVADLMLFLEQNPDLQSEFDSFDNTSLTPDNNIKFDNKIELKKNSIVSVNGINADNFETVFISAIEDQLDSRQKSNLLLFLEKNSFLKKEYELFRKTILVPDKSVIFEYKKSLQKKTLLIYQKQFLYYATAAAAILLLFFSVIVNFEFNDKSDIYLANSDSEINTIDEGTTVDLVPEESYREPEKQSFNNGR
jgi:hypothetical protein